MPLLETPIADINFYCKKIAKRLKNLDLKTARDLLFYYPFRYEDWSKIKKISELLPNEPATVKVKIEQIKNFRSPRMHKKITEAIVRDETGKIKVLWFNQWYIGTSLAPGDDIYLAAKMNDDGDIISPGYEKVSDRATHTGRIVPIYPLTAGLTQKHIRSAVKSALPFLDDLADYLPEEIKQNNNLTDLKSAILNIHFPSSEELRQEAVRRLSFDELFFAQLKNFWLKHDLEKRAAAPISFHKEATAKFVDNLPFKLTEAQRKASWEILKDIQNSHPMNRLLDGDVGSGKTLVAALAVYNTALSGAQSAILAPTEILATQHYETFCKLFNGLNIKIGLVTHNKKISNFKLPARNATHSVAGGQISNKKPEEITLSADIIIGTHALIQNDIKFNNLALAVVDEQHRFGVEQRARLASTRLDSAKRVSESRRAKLTNGNTIFPHLLSMTATPIPRTLSLISYGDLDLSILDQMPQGRKEIKTYAVAQEKRASSYDFIRKQIQAGRQAFVICPLIDESDKLGVKSVAQEYKKLNEQIFPEFQMGMLHGKLKSAEKDEIMQKFKNNEIKILVSTSVVEVGVDIPNATIMMIEGSERFGLAQLHQFRGRVGRSVHQSYCLLFPTDGSFTQRLKAMETINDGFRLAEIDLQLRGPGKIYSTEQSGKLEFQLADITNVALIKQTRDAANNLIQSDPELKKYPHLREYLEEKLKKIHLE